LALIFIHDDDALPCPSVGDGAVDQGLWPGCGLHGLDDVLGMGLAHLHHRQAPQMIVVALRCDPSHASWLQSWLSHRAPPAGEAGCAGR
jgi:hypothetical protein